MNEKEIIKEINALRYKDMPKVEKLYSLQGDFVNLEYQFDNGKTTKLLDDNKKYLGAQLEVEGSCRCYGVIADEKFIIICTYGENGSDPKLELYISR